MFKRSMRFVLFYDCILPGLISPPNDAWIYAGVLPLGLSPILQEVCTQSIYPYINVTRDFRQRQWPIPNPAHMRHVSFNTK